VERHTTCIVVRGWGETCHMYGGEKHALLMVERGRGVTYHMYRWGETCHMYGCLVWWRCGVTYHMHGSEKSGERHATHMVERGYANDIVHIWERA